MVGLAVAVILDATVVPLPARAGAMVMVGNRNWYMPRWLDRAMPHLSIEGAEFFLVEDELEMTESAPVPAGADSDPSP